MSRRLLVKHNNDKTQVNTSKQPPAAAAAGSVSGPAPGLRPRAACCMDLRVERVLGSTAYTNNAVAVAALAAGAASVACAGAGAVLVPLAADSGQRFYYRAPKPGPAAAPPSPRGSPEPASPNAHRLVRVNRAGCVAASSQMVAVGEASGYLPRLLLYDLASGDCLSVLRDQHQFGVQHLRFSPAGTHLASLGTPQDGFLYVWSVTQGQLELQASNKCISEVRDVAWLNENQLVTCGVRHIKLWTVGAESILSGRSVLLKETLDQTFECAAAACGALGAGILVGTARGELYKMPEIQRLAALAPAQPIKSIVVRDTPFVHVFVSTQTHIYEFRDSFAAPCKVYPFGSAALFLYASEVLFLSDSSTTGRCVMRLPASPSTPVRADYEHEAIDYKGMQLSSSSEGKVVLWRPGESVVYRWSNQPVNMPFSDVTVAYELSENGGLMVGTLCGDLWLGGDLFNAHNGPITDVHELGSLAVSSGRDRCVQLWRRAEAERSDDAASSAEGSAQSSAAGSASSAGNTAGNTATWSLVQTLMFTSPILKAKLCARADGAYALVCCAANKTAYCYSTTAFDPQTEGPVFADPPKSVLLKGMPFDVAALDETAVISTNDKHVCVLDPFGEEKLKLRWRAHNANMESLNVTHMRVISYSGTRYLLAAGSDKCVHLFSYPKGELVASQWGHGEAISGVAWTGSEALSAGDSVFVASIVPSEAPRVGRPRSSSFTEPQSSPLPRFVIPSSMNGAASSGAASSAPGATAASPPKESSAPRKVYSASPPPRPRSVSPQRMVVPSRALARSPSPTRERIQPGAPRDRDNEKQPALAYKPLRLATPTSQARNVAAGTASQARQDPTENLMSALQQFVDQPISQHDTQKLKTLLVAALNKIDGFSLAEELGERLCGRVEARIDRHLAELLKRA